MCLIRAHMLSPDMKDNGFKLHYSCSRKPDHKAEPSGQDSTATALLASTASVLNVPTGTVDLNGSCVPSVITIFSAPDYVYVSPQPSRESVEKMSTIGSVREIVPVASGYPVNDCRFSDSLSLSCPPFVSTGTLLSQQLPACVTILQTAQPQLATAQGEHSGRQRASEASSVS